MGCLIPKRPIASRTFLISFSKANSGVWIPIISSPWSLYFSYHIFMYGKVLWQLMQLYVKKSMRIIFLPTSSCRVMPSVLTNPDGFTISLYVLPSVFVSCSGVARRVAGRITSNPPLIKIKRTRPVMYSGFIYYCIFCKRSCSILVISK